MVTPIPDDLLEVAEVPALTTLTTGTKSPIKIKLRRGKEVLGPVQISVRDLPPKITSIDGAAEGTDGEVSLDVAADAKQGEVDANIELMVVATRRKVSKAVKLFVRGPAGTIDTTFGENGAVAVPFGPTDNAVGYDLAVAPDDSIILSSSCTPNGMQVACFARLTPNGALDTKFVKKTGTPYAYSSTMSVPRSSAFGPQGTGLTIGGTTEIGAAIGFLDNDGVTAGFGLSAPGASNNGPVYGLTVRQTDGVMIAAFETTGTTSFAVFAGIPGFGTNGYSTGLTFGTTSSAPMAAGGLKNGNLFVLGVGKTAGTSYFGIVTLDATTGAKTGGTSVAVPGADRGGYATGYAQLADGSIITGTGLGSRVLKFLPDGSALDPTFSTDPIVGKTFAVATDSQGRILVLSGGISRLTPQGAIDPSFTFVDVPLSGETPAVLNGVARRIALQKDGRIIFGSGLGAARFWN